MTGKFNGIKAAAEYRRGELTRDILKLIGADVLGSAPEGVQNTIELIEIFSPKSRDERNKIWKAIKYLEERNDIALEKKGGIDLVVLTKQGKERLTEETIWEMTLQRPHRWDRKWRLVMFDLPSEHERERRAFRLKLQDFGFAMYQKSVFIYPFDCNNEVITVARFLGVDPYVRYVVATEINDVNHFAKLFDLL